MASECYCHGTVTSFSPSSSSCCSYSPPFPLVRFVINPSWDDNLEELAQQRTEVEQSIMAEFKRAQSLASTMDIKCENDARRGVVMRTARSNDKKLRKLMGYVYERESVSTVGCCGLVAHVALCVPLGPVVPAAASTWSQC